mmetsp:Transcript_14902/g.26760  ORF Transcript_14902/g.26760 Transcript_14902/m.26760 type:complete len:188 (+) Transcript_14902:37-600(+)
MRRSLLASNTGASRRGGRGMAVLCALFVAAGLCVVNVMFGSAEAHHSLGFATTPLRQLPATSPYRHRCLSSRTAVPAAAGKTVTVSVTDNSGKQVQFKAKTGETLRDVLLENKVDVYDWWGKGMNCGGTGNCLTCLVDVAKGGDAKSDYEISKLERQKNKPKSWRLACQTIIQGNVVVNTKPQEAKK